MRPDNFMAALVSRRFKAARIADTGGYIPNDATTYTWDTFLYELTGGGLAFSRRRDRISLKSRMSAAVAKFCLFRPQAFR
jgi:hypothetical protein